MLNLFGSGRRYCDGVSRRSFLKIGGLAMGGLALPDLLRAEAQAGISGSHKAVIMVYLSGGLSHQDTFDLKPDSPDGIRGEFKPISTVVPGTSIGELLPEIAKVTDKLAILRSIVGLRDEHSSWQNLTGYPMSQAQREDRPHFGSVISRVQGTVDPVVPPFVDLFPVMQHKPYNSAGGGFLGQAYKASKLGGGDDLELTRQTAVEAGRFSGRRRLLDEFDGFRRSVEGSSVDGMDAQYRRAFDVLTSDKVAKALDVEREDPRVRDRYGKGSAKHLGDGAPMWNDQLLIARRLVEAGARCVSVAYGFWDTHGGNFTHLKNHLPLFDRGIAGPGQGVVGREPVAQAAECRDLIEDLGQDRQKHRAAHRTQWRVGDDAQQERQPGHPGQLHGEVADDDHQSDKTGAGAELVADRRGQRTGSVGDQPDEIRRRRQDHQRGQRKQPGHQDLLPHQPDPGDRHRQQVAER